MRKSDGKKRPDSESIANDSKDFFDALERVFGQNEGKFRAVPIGNGLIRLHFCEEACEPLGRDTGYTPEELRKIHSLLAVAAPVMNYGVYALVGYGLLSAMTYSQYYERLQAERTRRLGNQRACELAYLDVGMREAFKKHAMGLAKSVAVGSGLWGTGAYASEVSAAEKAANQLGLTAEEESEIKTSKDAKRPIEILLAVFDRL